MNDQSVGPSRGYYVLAALVVVAGTGLFAFFLWKNLSGMADALTQVVVPGTKELALREPGTYTVFYERESVVGNKVYSTGENLSGLECSLVSRPSSLPVHLSKASMSSSYSMGGRSGTSVWEFKVVQPGTFELACGFGEEQNGPEIVLAIGKDFTGKLVGTILGGIGLMFGSVALGIVIALITLVKREKAKKALKSVKVVPIE